MAGIDSIGEKDRDEFGRFLDGITPPETVAMPATVLAAGALTATHKLLWAWMHFGQLSAKGLSQVSRFSRQTVRAGLDALETAGLVERTEPGPYGGHGYCLPPTSGRVTELPVQLLMDGDLRPRAKIIYCCLQLAPGLYAGQGALRCSKLAVLAAVSCKTVRRALADLQAQGWVTVTQEHRSAPLRFALHNPHLVRQLDAVKRCWLKVKRRENVGETIAREGVKVLARSEEYIENARLHWLENPDTGERLELDMWFPDERVGIEFDGPQHYGPTAKSSARTYQKQQTRDLLTEALTAQQGGSVVRVPLRDLTLTKLLQLVDGVLPLRDLGDQQPLIEYLEYELEMYHKSMRNVRTRPRFRPRKHNEPLPIVRH